MKIINEIKKNFPNIEKLFNQKTLKEFIKCPYNDLTLYHFSLGIWIRNNLLKDEDVLYKMFNDSGITQKDDMSFFIINLFYIYLHTK